MPLKSPIFFESAGDERGTPQALFDALDAEFHFDLDAAAGPRNHKCETYFGEGGVAFDALQEEWAGLTVFLNPPYSACYPFIKKAREEADKGATVVLVVPVRSDTKWWHEFVWDVEAWGQAQAAQTFADAHPGAQPDGAFRPGVRCRLVKGRLDFTLSVTDEMRAWICAELKAIETIKQPDGTYAADETERNFLIAALVKATGLPKMAIERIERDFPDEDLLDAAPFPSCILIFTAGAVDA